MSKTLEWKDKYRPSKFEDVIGQEATVRTLITTVAMKKVPHSIIFSGFSGCGKTTLARILAKMLLCVGQNLIEINCANFRGIDTVRDIQGRVNLCPMGGKSTVYIIDEAHKLTNDAQNGLLKVLEEAPAHAYFMLCTTDAGKLISAVKTRCTEYKVQALKDEHIKSLIQKIETVEKVKVNSAVESKIIQVAAGSARKAIVLLSQAAIFKDTEDQLNAIQDVDNEKKAIDVARLLFKKGVTWKEIQLAIKEVDDEPEGVRRACLSYANTIMLGGNKELHGRAWMVMNSLRDNWFDTHMVGLTMACYEIFCQKQ